MTDVQYQTVIMYYFNEMSVSEIAEFFECSKGTVLSRLNYSRAKMKKAITDYEKKSGDRLHGVVFVPLFGSIFKEEAKNITVPKIQVLWEALQTVQENCLKPLCQQQKQKLLQ